MPKNKIKNGSGSFAYLPDPFFIVTHLLSLRLLGT
jgi:hypothetical protein